MIRAHDRSNVAYLNVDRVTLTHSILLDFYSVRSVFSLENNSFRQFYRPFLQSAERRKKLCNSHRYRETTFAKRAFNLRRSSPIDDGINIQGKQKCVAEASLKYSEKDALNNER